MKQIQVSVTQGKVVGSEDILPNGTPYYSFKGIPYALPPIGELRFKAPVPMESFPTEILDCTTERNVSFQKDPFTAEIVGSEDCLFLNVYTPTAKSKIINPLPVMLWIHGGAFMTGSGNTDYYSPEYLIREGVVVVTCNYRLGPFGFLCLPEAEIQGNAGIKDQLLVLKWVNANIAQFGGDPNNVTLFGESAGGVSVHLHAISEQSKPYIHKAICQSGTLIMEWVMQVDPVGKTKRLAEILGCPVGSSEKQILEYLCQLSAADLHSKMLLTLSADERRRGLPIPFKPCVEQDKPGAFLTKSVLEMLNNPNAIEVPLILGYNNSEGIMPMEAAGKKLEIYDKDLARMIPRSLDVPSEPAASLSVSNAIRDIYFKGRTVDKTKIIEMTALQTDYHTVIHCVITAELHARTQNRSPLYFYRFSFDGEYNFIKKFILAKLGMTANELPGASHVDDIFYLFNSKVMHDDIRDEESKSAKIAKKMCKMWTNFAKYGNPTPDAGINKNDMLTFQWKPVEPVLQYSTQPMKLDYLEIGDKIEMRTNPDRERIDFWRQEYLKWNGSFLKPKL